MNKSQSLCFVVCFLFILLQRSIGIWNAALLGADRTVPNFGLAYAATHGDEGIVGNQTYVPSSSGFQRSNSTDRIHPHGSLPLDIETYAVSYEDSPLHFSVCLLTMDDNLVRDYSL